jgi:hypothetical protein
VKSRKRLEFLYHKDKEEEEDGQEKDKNVRK